MHQRVKNWPHLYYNFSDKFFRHQKCSFSQNCNPDSAKITIMVVCSRNMASLTKFGLIFAQPKVEIYDAKIIWNFVRSAIYLEQTTIIVILTLSRFQLWLNEFSMLAIHLKKWPKGIISKIDQFLTPNLSLKVFVLGKFWTTTIYWLDALSIVLAWDHAQLSLHTTLCLLMTSHIYTQTHLKLVLT